MPRHLAIGDVHGCYHSLSELASFVGLRDDDVVITLGDYVNRGPDSRAVLEWLIELDRRQTLIPLRGNHEIMTLEARDNELMLAHWLGYGGDATLRSYAARVDEPGIMADIPDSHWRFLEERLTPYYETDEHFFVHANADPDTPLDEQPDYMLYWEQFDDPPRQCSGKVMVCGHTSQKSGLPAFNDNAICIDTNACRGGWLTCLQVETGQLWQTNERGEKRSFSLDEVENMRNQLGRR